jgi:hypothetical protein
MQIKAYSYYYLPTNHLQFHFQSRASLFCVSINQTNSVAPEPEGSSLHS